MRIIMVLALLALGGCGRPATRADCELIVDHNVEVQLRRQGSSDPLAAEQEKRKVRAEFKAKIDECVGKRITDDMLACVKAADTTEKMDKCLR